MTTKADAINVKREIVALASMKLPQLRARYEILHGGEPSRSGNRAWLIRRIAWRLQAKAEGDLSERAKRLAAELARDEDLRINPPRGHEPDVVARIGSSSASPTASLAPGSVLTRSYRGRLITVAVLDDGFEYEGERYTSLSAVAKAITGAAWNGRLFFGLPPSTGARLQREVAS